MGRRRLRFTAIPCHWVLDQKPPARRVRSGEAPVGVARYSRSVVAWLLAIPVVAFVVSLVVGALTGRAKVVSCCSVADPRCDLRMQAAFVDDGEETVTGS